MIIGTLLEYFYEKHKLNLINQYLNRKLSITNLEEIDSNHDGKVSEKEFLEFMLIQCEMANEEDIEKINKKFRELDVDASGDLDAYDVLE